MDITYMPTALTGEKYLLVLIDCFTKYVWTWALKNRDAESVLSAIKSLLEKEQWEILQSDNGGEFRNGDLHDFVTSIETRIIHSAPHHPQTNGQVERTNQTLKKIFKADFFNHLENRDKWPEVMPKIIGEYNQRKHATIGV
jgi:transposase InsO family protein